MVLSCMIRMGERFGKMLVAQVLTGSANKKVLEQNFDQLPTYGLLKQMSAKDVGDLIDFLTSEQYIGITGGQFPLLYVTQSGKEVLLGKKSVMRKEAVRISSVALDDPLFEELRSLRKEIAGEERVPPYLIFSDQALRDMCAKQPATSGDFLDVKGVGKQKAEKYGDRFIQTIGAFLAENEYEAKTVAEEEKPAKKAKAAVKNSHLDTYELYKDGMSLKEMAEERDLSVQTIESHLFRCLDEGMELNWSYFFTADEEEQILAVIDDAGSELLKPIKEALPEKISYTAIKAVLKKRQIETGEGVS